MASIMTYLDNLTQPSQQTCETRTAPLLAAELCVTLQLMPVILQVWVSQWDEPAGSVARGALQLNRSPPTQTPHLVPSCDSSAQLVASAGVSLAGTLARPSAADAQAVASKLTLLQLFYADLRTAFPGIYSSFYCYYFLVFFICFT